MTFCCQADHKTHAVQMQDGSLFLGFCPNSIFVITKNHYARFCSKGVHHLILLYSEDTHRQNGARSSLFVKRTKVCQCYLDVGVRRFNTIFFFPKTCQPNILIRMFHVESSEKGARAFLQYSLSADVMSSMGAVEGWPWMTREEEAICAEILPCRGEIGGRPTHCAFCLHEVCIQTNRCRWANGRDTPCGIGPLSRMWF